MDHIPISSILIDERVRKEMGDIAALARSISEVGMLQPVLVGESRRLIAGVRRILAAKSLGWEQVPAFIVGNFKDAIHKLKAERDENTCRKAFTPSELGEVAAQLLALEKPAAKERQAAVGGKSPGKSACGTVPQAPEGKARDKVGEALGVSGKTAEKAAAVVTAAKEDPESFGDLPAQMDANGVAPAHREMTARKSIFCARCARVGPIKDCPACKEERAGSRKGRTAGSHEPKAAPKTGKVIFDRKAFDKSFGDVVRTVDRVEKGYGHKQTPGGEALRKLLADFLSQFTDWRKQLAGAK